ncbi:MAG: hypothetical protein HYT70_03015 [Candidatus Aenigmarchaeota archaeon]|nr:hypothetical protein [Candidatus Aenigmarchaeota archaeon]
MKRITKTGQKAAKEARKLADMATKEARTRAAVTLKRTNHELKWAGPIILMSMGFIWLLHGYGLLPGPLNVPWLGGILLALGFTRLVMYALGHY